MSGDLVLRSQRVVLPGGERPASVRVRDGRIVEVGDYGRRADGPGVDGPGVDGPGVDRPRDYGRRGDAPRDEDLGDLALLPGLVDTHVHVNEPGRTEWEGFDTATRAALAGGVTTIVDMPLNSLPPTVSVAALQRKHAAAEGRCHVDVGFWGGAVPGNAAELPALHAAGVFGFKAFLVDSGVPEFPPLDADGLHNALSTVDALFLVHAEDPRRVEPAPASHRYADFLGSRPPAAEVAAVATALAAARGTAARLHILHVSAAGAAAAVAAGKAAGQPVTAETCPHYLALAAEDVPDGATEFKCCPPIRDRDNRDALWTALRTGTIDAVVSDHSPCPPVLKTGDFATAWGGIASLQIGFQVVWTQARQRGFGLADVVRWMARRPAEIAGLRRKGRIAVGADADLVAVDPDDLSTVDPTRLHHRHPVTPYAGAALRGAVRSVWLRGTPVTPDGAPRGRLLTREDG